MADQSQLVRCQLAFAAHIRDPSGRPCPAGVEDRRMAIYRDLFYNNVESLLAGNFPVIRRILANDHWQQMVRDFFITHRCQTPFFLELGQELLNYLQNEREADSRDPPFLLELAHYEWVELALSISDRNLDPKQADPNGDLMTGRPLVSPLAWSLSYRYPVHRISPDFQPQEPPAESTRLVVYRDLCDQVRFLEINAVTQRLLELLAQNPDWTGRHAVQQVVEELRHPQPEIAMNSGRRLLYDLRGSDILLGTRPLVTSP